MMELDTRTKASIQALIEQRNHTMDVIAQMAGELAVVKEQLDAANKKLAEKDDA